MKKLFLASMILVAIGVCVWFVVLIMPRVIAGHHIANLEQNFTSPTKAHASYDKLVMMGRLAVPSLVDNALAGDPQVQAARHQECPPRVQALDWLDDIRVMRRENSKQYRADACALVLLTAWQSGWVSQADMARLLPGFEDYCLWIVRRRIPQDFGKLELVIATQHPFDGNEVAGELWLKRRIRWVIDGADVERGPGVEESSQWWNYRAVGGTNRATREGIFGGSAGSTSSIGLDTANFGRGSHRVFAHVQLGPGIPGNNGRSDEPPPWHVEFTIGPLDFEVVNEIVIESRTNPQLDTTVFGILDQWIPNVEPDKRTSKLAVHFPVVPTKFPEPMIGVLTVRVDGEVVRTMPRYDMSNLPALKLLINQPTAALHTVQVEFVPDEQRAVRTMFDSFWGGQYISPVTEFELGPEGDVLRVRRLEKSPETDRSN